MTKEQIERFITLQEMQLDNWKANVWCRAELSGEYFMGAQKVINELRLLIGMPAK